MSDIIDIAQQREAEFLAEALTKHRITDAPSHSHCIDCGEAIPEARRMALRGVKRCIACQTEHEEGDGHGF